MGYGDDHIRTELAFGDNPKTKPVTAYFLFDFDVPNDSAIDHLVGGISCDDGAAVYLNGHEVFRRNLPEAVLRHRTRAIRLVGSEKETTLFRFQIDRALLKPERNLLAVRVHQANASSSDLGFDLELLDVDEMQAQVAAAIAKKQYDQEHEVLDEIRVIIAKHVLIWEIETLDGPEPQIATWEKVEQAIFDAPRRVRLSIQTTAGVDRIRRKESSKSYHAIYSRFQDQGKKVRALRQGSVGQVVSTRYDLVKEPADLVQDESLKITGTVLDNDGQIVEGAEVVLIYGPELKRTHHGDVRPFRLYMKGGRLRARTDELVCVTKADGRFRHYRPGKANYSLLVFHPLGFAHIASGDWPGGGNIRLSKWAKVTVNVPAERDDGFRVDADLNSILPTKLEWPSIQIYYYDEQRTANDAIVFAHVAPGSVSVFKSIDLENHGGLGFPADKFDVSPGDEKIVQLEELTDSQRAVVARQLKDDELFDLLLGKAPDFRVNTIGGQQITLGDLRGKLVVLNFRNPSQTKFAAQASELQELAKKYRNDPRLAVINFGHVTEAKEIHEARDKEAFPWPQVLVTDVQRATYPLKPYLQFGFQRTYLVGADGEVLQRNLVGADLTKLVEYELGNLTEQASSD